MTGKAPAPQAISALLRKAGFDRSETLSRGRYTEGFCVRGGTAAVYVDHRCETPLLSPSPATRERFRQCALEMTALYAEAVRAAGWPAEVIHLAAPIVRVTAKED